MAFQLFILDGKFKCLKVFNCTNRKETLNFWCYRYNKSNSPNTFINKFIFRLYFYWFRKCTIKGKPGEKLCVALQGMGTTFIKLGQFLATRPYYWRANG